MSLRARLLSIVWLSVAIAIAAVAPASAAQDDPDWPCVQVLVPRIAAGQIWAGPPVEPVAEAWRSDAAVRELAAELAARRTPIEEAKQRIEAFAASLAPETKDRRLTVLFAGVLETINDDRASLISGIKRFARKQKGLSHEIQEANAILRELADAGTPDQTARQQALREQREWAIRILEERESSLRYLCEQPVRLEQRAFALAREIAAHLG